MRGLLVHGILIAIREEQGLKVCSLFFSVYSQFRTLLHAESQPGLTAILEKSPKEMTPQERCLFIDGQTPEGGLYTDAQRPIHPDANSSWQVGSDPWRLPESVLSHLEEMGQHLHAFYKAANLLYNHSWRGIQPEWVAGYLDQGKPESVVALGRMNRIKQHLPMVIRPDIIPTREGMIATELDSVPGGIGFTASLGARYSALDEPIVGGPDGMVDGFERMLRSFAGCDDPAVGIVISEESVSWRPEMVWIADRLNARGLETHVTTPEEIVFTEDGLYAPAEGDLRRIDVVYRFFELFDLKNIPKMELILYAAKKNLVKVTPPLKSYLEEKMMMALFQHPMLRDFWQQQLSSETLSFLEQLFPRTWILDPAPLPPHATIHGLEVKGRPFADWRHLGHLGQKDRQLVIKPSGFSELAWGSRGVAIGHDVSEHDWQETINTALDRFETNPHILQIFHNGATFPVEHYDFESGEMRKFRGRVRLQPYYFVVDDAPVLSGVQATICPPDKKLLHGMVDAVVLPCGLLPQPQSVGNP